MLGKTYELTSRINLYKNGIGNSGVGVDDLFFTA